MNKNIKVSVIIPTYNDSKHIAHSIDSVLNQSFKNCEIIVIDDGSTDDTKSILKSYIESDQIIYLYQENKGQTITRNNGIFISRGIYVAFIDSDDKWIDRDKLKKQIEFLDSNPDYVLVGTGGIVVDEFENRIVNYKVPNDDLLIKKSILLRNPFILSSVVVRNNIIKKAGLFLFKKDINAEDYNLWLRIGAFGKLYNLVQPMTMYMMREGNTSSNHKKSILRSNISLIKEYKNKYPNYNKAIIFSYFKYYIYIIINVISNKKIKNRIKYFMFVKYRKL